MIGKINLLWKTISEKLNNVSTLENAGNPMASKSIAAISHDEREELKKKGIKSPSKFLSPKYLSPIMTYGLRSRQKPSNPNKISNFVGRIRGLKIFIGSFAYKCDFMILEDTTSIFDRHLGEMVFGRPFIEGTSLVYNDEEGTVMLKQDDEKITFKMPHTMKIFKQIRLMGLSTDSIPPSAYEENFGHGRTHYCQSLFIGDEYKQYEGDRRGIRHLMRLEKEMMDNK
ncbi:hypothetical protein Tco_0495807 [Tanacetum coccineum]